MRGYLGILCAVFFLQGLYSVSAQTFGGNPSSLKWKQIDTDTARVIFPEGIEPTAKRVASVIHGLQKDHAATIGNHLRKINIVLQNQTTFANGYVGLGPWRSEFYLFTPQNSFDQGSLHWADKLAVHEYRHIQQFSNFNIGLSKAASILFGQQGQALANSAAVPDYFFEGDAVFSETVLTEQGRGRQPLFFSGYQSIFKQNLNYSYQKLRSGSLKDYVPNHYELGYLLVGYGRQKYGTNFWKSVTQDAARFKPLFYPWQGAVKKQAGVSYTRFVQNALDYYKQKWQGDTGLPVNYLSKLKKYPSDYKYPTVASDGSIITLKSSYQQIPAFYRISANGKEQKIAVRDLTNDDYFSYNNGLIVYSVFKPDARWGYREYADVKLLNVETGEQEKLTGRQRFFSPDISHSGQNIVAVEMQTGQLSNLVIIDRQGKRIFRSNGDAGTVFTYPKFSANDSLIYTAVRNEAGEMALQQINIFNSKKINILPFSQRVIGFLQVKGDTVFFTSTYNGMDEAWAFVEKAHSVYRLANTLGGLYHASIDHLNGKLVASTFTADGFRLTEIPLQKLSWQKINDSGDALPDLYIPEALKQEDSKTLSEIPKRDFSISRYHKTFQLFNFHSWRPSYDQPEISFTMFGQNVLNTLQTELAYTYNRNESSNKLGLNMIYGAWYLQPYVALDQTWNRTINYNKDTTLFYNEQNAAGGVRLPLNFSGGKQYRYLTISSSINTKQLHLTGIGKNIFENKNFNFLQNRIFYSGQIQKAVRQIYPHWAQTLSLQYRNVVNKYSARQFLASGNIYLPGFLNNHNMVITAAYSARDTLNQYFFSDNFPFSRGYNAVDFPRMWRLGINYHFPLAYPDFGIANIVYLKRVRANTFYDYTQTKSLRTGNKFFFGSTGVEVFADTKWWNQQNVTIGVRYSRLLNSQFRGITQPNQWEIILPINLLD